MLGLGCSCTSQPAKGSRAPWLPPSLPWGRPVLMALTLGKCCFAPVAGNVPPKGAWVPMGPVTGAGKKRKGVKKAHGAWSLVACWKNAPAQCGSNVPLRPHRNGSIMWVSLGAPQGTTGAFDAPQGALAPRHSRRWRDRDRLSSSHGPVCAFAPIAGSKGGGDSSSYKRYGTAYPSFPSLVIWLRA